MPGSDGRRDDRIPTTHVGSLIRPPALLEFIAARQARAALRRGRVPGAASRAVVAEVVRRQAEVGIDLPSDGEFGKAISWSQYALERLSGFERRPRRRAPIPSRAAPIARASPSSTPSSIAPTAPPATRGRQRADRGLRRADRIHRPERAAARHRQLQGGARRRRASTQGFLPVAAPASVIPDRKNEYYTTDEECVARDRRGDAHRVPGDRRRRAAAAARRRALRGHLRPHGAARDARRIPRWVGDACRGAERRARGHSARSACATTSAGAAGRPAHHRRAAARTSST